MEVPTRSGKNIEDEIPSFESNRELMPFSRVIGARKKRSVRRHHGQRGEIEVVSASFAVPFHVLNHLGSRRSEEHTSELQSHSDLVCRLLLEKKNSSKPTTATFSARSTSTPV